MRWQSKIGCFRKLGSWFLLPLLTHCGIGIHLGGNSPFKAPLGPLSISQVSPALGARGTLITLTGSGFTTDVSITVGGSPCGNATILSTTQMTCLPSVHSPGLVDLTASNPAGENSVLKSAFTYISFVFAANVTSNTLSGYSMDPVSGSLAGISSAQGNLNGPRVLLIDPYGRYLYVLDQFSADIAIFSISPTSGNLTLLSSTTVGGAPKSAAMSSDGRFIYVLQSGNNAIASLTVDPKTGVPSLNPTTVATGNSPDTLVLHPNGHYLYASNNGAGTISSFAVDSSTGTLSSLEADVMTSTSPRGLAISPNGNFLYVASDEVSSIELFSIDPTTGQLNAMGTAASVTSSGTMFLAFEPSGKHLYATSPSPTTSAWAFAADPVGGTLQSPTSFYSSNGVFSLLVDSLGKFLYLSDTSNNQIASFIISSSVAPAPTTTAPTGSGPGAMVID